MCGMQYQLKTPAMKNFIDKESDLRNRRETKADENQSRDCVYSDSSRTSFAGVWLRLRMQVRGGERSAWVCATGIDQFVGIASNKILLALLAHET